MYVCVRKHRIIEYNQYNDSECCTVWTTRVVCLSSCIYVCMQVECIHMCVCMDVCMYVCTTTCEKSSFVFVWLEKIPRVLAKSEELLWARCCCSRKTLTNAYTHITYIYRYIYILHTYIHSYIHTYIHTHIHTSYTYLLVFSGQKWINMIEYRTDTAHTSSWNGSLTAFLQYIKHIIHHCRS